MKDNIWRAVLAAIAVLFLASPAHAQYYNFDFLTLPNGPIELENASASFNGGQWTLFGDAVDLSSQTFSNVKFLNEWMFDGVPSAFTYLGSGAWSATDGNLWSVANASGYLSVSDVSPLPYADMSAYFPGPTAYVAADDLMPYINIGTVSPGSPVPFMETVNASSYYYFDFVSSFISTSGSQQTQSVPEPSTLVLLGGGLMAIVFVVGKRRRAAAI